MYNNDNTYDDTSDNTIHKNDYIKRTIMKMIKIGIKKIIIFIIYICLKQNYIKQYKSL